MGNVGAGHISAKTGTKRFVVLLAVLWSVVVALSAAWNLYEERLASLRRMGAEARSAFNKDLVYRRWAAGHGGVYVPATEDTPPNPYLAHIKERDLVTPSGRQLTLVNPAYMTRQVHELALEQYGIRGHITSLNPLRPENTPDPWEAEALRMLEKGAEEEVISREEIEGEPFLRLMRPLMTEEECLKCHAGQGYKLGELRGGISVSIPLAPAAYAAARRGMPIATGHLLPSSLGVF